MRADGVGDFAAPLGPAGAVVSHPRSGSTALLPVLGGQLAGREGPFDSIEEAIADIRAGKMVIVLDDEDRENEGDLVMAAAEGHAATRSTSCARTPAA